MAIYIYLKLSDIWYDVRACQSTPTSGIVYIGMMAILWYIKDLWGAKHTIRFLCLLSLFLHLCPLDHHDPGLYHSLSMLNLFLRLSLMSFVFYFVSLTVDFTAGNRFRYMVRCVTHDHSY